MAFEGHALFRQLAQPRQAHHLKPAGIGEDRLVPVHELMQPAQTVDPFGSGAQHQMIGIAQQDIRTGRGDAFGHHRLDRGGSAHRHEGRRANIAPRGRDDTGTRRTIAGLKIEREFFHDCGYKMSPA